MRPCWAARITLNVHSLKNPVPESMVLATAACASLTHAGFGRCQSVPNMLTVCGVVQRSAEDSPGKDSHSEETKVFRAHNRAGEMAQ